MHRPIGPMFLILKGECLLGLSLCGPSAIDLLGWKNPRLSSSPFNLLGSIIEGFHLSGLRVGSRRTMIGVGWVSLAVDYCTNLSIANIWTHSIIRLCMCLQKICSGECTPLIPLGRYYLFMESIFHLWFSFNMNIHSFKIIFCNNLILLSHDNLCMSHHFHDTK